MTFNKQLKSLINDQNLNILDSFDLHSYSLPARRLLLR